MDVFLLVIKSSSGPSLIFSFFFNDTATTEIYTLSLHDALPISYAFDGFPYVSQNEFRQSKLAPVARLVRYMSSGSATLRWLQARRLDPGDVVIAYGGHSLFVSRLSSLCRAWGVHLICDCTEWYEPSHLVGGKWGLVRWDEEFRMRVVHPRVGQMIVISSYLEKFYRGLGTAVICVPPLVDMAAPKWNSAVRTERTGPLRL